MPSTPPRAVTSVLALALAAAGLVTAASSAGAAAAAAPCSVTTAGPARVSIDRSFQRVPITIRTTCSGLGYADVFLSGPAGTAADDVDVPWWDPATDRATYPWSVYGDTRPGTWVTSGLYAEPAGTAVTATYGRTVLKYGSKAGLSGARTGQDVRLTACASVYEPSSDVYRPWTGQTATLQRLAADGATWDYVRRLTTGERGCVTAGLRAPAAATYRVVTYESTVVFPRASPSVRL